MARTACLVCFVRTVNGRSKKRKKRSLLPVALVAGTQQNLSSLYYLYVYGPCPPNKSPLYLPWLLLFQVVTSQLCKYDKFILQLGYMNSLQLFSFILNEI
jgi:hypothetical protein